MYNIAQFAFSWAWLDWWSERASQSFTHNSYSQIERLVEEGEERPPLRPRLELGREGKPLPRDQPHRDVGVALPGAGGRVQLDGGLV